MDHETTRNDARGFGVGVGEVGTTENVEHAEVGSGETDCRMALGRVREEGGIFIVLFVPFRVPFAVMEDALSC